MKTGKRYVIIAAAAVLFLLCLTGWFAARKGYQGELSEREFTLPQGIGAVLNSAGVHSAVVTVTVETADPSYFVCTLNAGEAYTFVLEQYDDLGHWRELVPSRFPLNRTEDPPQTLVEGENVLYLDWEAAYGSLKPGIYRLALCLHSEKGQQEDWIALPFAV